MRTGGKQNRAGRHWPGSLFLVLGLGCSSGAGPSTPPPQPLASDQSALPAATPLVFVKQCLAEDERKPIQDYRLTLEKQERINGELHPPETIDVTFRAQPYSVLMRWRHGARAAQALLYVEGRNGDEMMVHPTGLIGEVLNTVSIDPEGERARSDSRFDIKDFGLEKTLRRIVQSWEKAQQEGTLHVEYRGIHDVPEAGNRPCYELRQTGAVGSQGVTQMTVFIDRETRFPVGTILLNTQNELVGKYFYRDIQLNPSFVPDPFQPSSLTP